MTSHPRRWWALLAMVPASLIVGIDATVLGLALPTLATTLDASTAQLQWFVSAYMLVFAAVMVPAGLLADRYGRKRVLLLALVVLGAGSLACAYAETSAQFLAARILLGVGAAMVVPAAVGAIPSLFSEEERPKAVAAIMAATMLGQPIGPLLGGWLLTEFWWGSVFIINIPVVVVALVAAATLVPESRSDHKPRFDLPGILTSSTGLALLTYGVIRAGQDGWSDTIALGAMAAGAATLAGFVLLERRVRQPLVDLRLFRSPGFTWGTLLATLVSFSMMGVMFITPLYFQEVLGIDAFGNGLRQLPLIAALLVGAVAATRVASRLGAHVAVSLGFALLGCGLALGGLTSAGSGSGWAMSWMAVAGLGLGVALPTTMDAAIGALSPEHASVGSGLIQALRMVGGAFGAAILGSVVNAGYRRDLDVTGLPGQVADALRESVSQGVAVARQLGSGDVLEAVRSAFVHGMDVALFVCAGAAAAGVVLAVRFMPRRRAAGATDARESGANGPAGDEEIESAHGVLVVD
jgi:EmrB/QacA subfamily drug resistance transporter